MAASVVSLWASPSAATLFDLDPIFFTCGVQGQINHCSDTLLVKSSECLPAYICGLQEEPWQQLIPKVN